MKGKSSATACAMIVIATSQVLGQSGSESPPDLAWVRQYAQGSEFTNDAVQSVGADSEGYVYVLGNSPSRESEFFVMKYAPDGTQLWNQTVGSSVFKPQKMEVDPAGNIYLVGNDWSTHSMVTARYGADGGRQWISRKSESTFACERLGFGTDRIAVDANGNVVVAGCDYNYVTGLNDEVLDVVTVKYNDQGVEQWTAIYSGTDSLGNDTHDWAVGIGISESGDVFLAGASQRLEMVDGNQVLSAVGDLKTIRYDADGNLVWVNTYSDPSSYESIATGLAIDYDGSVIVTGTSGGPSSALETVKYNRDGALEWVARYEGSVVGYTEERPAGGIGIDEAGNVYIAGTERTGTSDFVVVKYNQSGVQQWRQAYDNDGGDDRLEMIVVDAPGNVFLTGMSHTWIYPPDADEICEARSLIVMYDAEGDTRWSTSGENGECEYGEMPIIDAAVDAQSNLITVSPRLDNSTGYPRQDFATAKHDLDGTELWTEVYLGKELLTKGQPTAMAIDADDNVIVAGWTDGGPNGRDLTVTKFSPNGDQLWVTDYDGLGRANFPTGIALDADGNIVVIDRAFITLKLNADGELLWDKTLEGPAGIVGYALGLAVGISGSIYVAGGSRVGGSGQSVFDFATVKYSPEGDAEWTASYDGGSGDIAQAIALDQFENIYVTGWSRGENGSPDFATVKYDGNGNMQWAARLDSPEAADEDTPAKIGVDGSGNVYVAGQTNESGGKYALIKYTPEGVEDWVAYYDNHGIEEGYGHAIMDLHVYDSGEAVVTGWSQGDDFRIDFATLKVSPSGDFVWEARFGQQPTDYDDWATALDLDESGNVYVTGISRIIIGGDTHSDLSTLMYRPDGTLGWVVSYPGAGSDVAVDRSGNVYVAGTSKDVFTVLKYSQSGAVAVEDHPVIPGLFLEQNYPNPFDDVTAIRFGIPESGHVNLSIFNVLGQRVATLVDEWRVGGAHTVKWRPGSISRGAYIARLGIENQVFTRKLLAN